MEGLLKYNYATADATGVAHDNIDAELANNRQEKLENIILQSKEEGSIRTLPYLQTAEGQQTMLDMVTGSSGAAIGRMSKAAITGGQRFIDPLFKQMTTGKPLPSALKSSKQFIDNIKWDNQTNAARLAWEKAMKRWGVRPTERVVNDPVTELLRSQKGSRFSPHRQN